MADFNPFDARLRTNPYAVYKELREEAPVFWSPVMQLWLLSRYDDCLAVLPAPPPPPPPSGTWRPPRRVKSEAAQAHAPPAPPHLLRSIFHPASTRRSR